MYEPASLGMFQCRLQRILCDFEVIMFFRKDPPQTEGRRHADLLIKTEPGDIEFVKREGGKSQIQGGRAHGTRIGLRRARRAEPATF